MQPGTSNIDIRRGDSFRRAYVLYEDAEQQILFDLTGFTARAQIRAPGSTSVMAAFEVAITLPSTVTLVLPAASSEMLVPGTQEWDLELTDASGWVSTFVEGDVVVAPDVSRDS